MTPEEYLRLFGQQIKSFSPEEQASLLEEIGSHIESHQEDVSSTKDPQERKREMMSELGSPHELAKRFKMIYRPDRLVEFLFVAVPYALYPFIAAWLQASFGPDFVARGEILLYSLLILAGIWRRSRLVTLFWATLVTGQIVSMLLAGYTFYGNVQSLLWLAFALGLLFLAGQIVWQNRSDPLTVVFAALPLLLCVYGSVFLLLRPALAGSSFGALDLFLLKISMQSGGYFDYFGHLAGVALFFLATQRGIRWLGLVLLGLLDTVGRSYLDLSYQSMPPWVYSVYVLIPLIVVLGGWWAERNKRKQLSSNQWSVISGQ